MNWIELKDYMMQASGLHRDALHVYAAVVIQLLAAGLSRRSLASPLPWAIVLLIQLANEGLDFWSEGGVLSAWRIDEAIRDSWNTMVMPTLLLLLARFTPSLLTGRVRRRGGRSY